LAKAKKKSFNIVQRQQPTITIIFNVKLVNHFETKYIHISKIYLLNKFH